MLQPVSSGKEMLLKMSVEEVPGIWTPKVPNCIQEASLRPTGPSILD